MSYAFNMHPMLSETLQSKIGFQKGILELSYCAGGEKIYLESEEIETLNSRINKLIIRDNKSQWNMDDFSLNIEGDLRVMKPEFLFGKNGVVCDDAILGISTIWISKDAHQRGVIKLCDFDKYSKLEDIKLKISFQSGQIRGDVFLRTILHLSKKGNPRRSERHLANTPGTVLGTLSEDMLIVDGDGSFFPIFDVEDKKRPLWWVECDWSDTHTDRFNEDNVKLCLNRAHPKYQELKLDEGINGSALFKDIIASSIEIIINRCKDTDNWEDILEGINYESGSISHAVNYLITSLNIRIDYPELLAETLRKDLDSRI